MRPARNLNCTVMSLKDETLAIQADAERIADIARDVRDCVEADEDEHEDEFDAATRRHEEFLTRERYRA